MRALWSSSVGWSTSATGPGVWGARYRRFVEDERRKALRSVSIQKLIGVEVLGALRGTLGVEALEFGCWSPSGSQQEDFEGEALWVLRGAGDRFFGAEVRESFGTRGAEAHERKYREASRCPKFLVLRWSRGVVGCTALAVSTALFELETSRGPSGRRTCGSKSWFWEGTKARAGRWSRRRDGQILGCQHAGGGALGSVTTFAWSPIRAGNVRSVCALGNRRQWPRNRLGEQET